MFIPRAVHTLHARYTRTGLIDAHCMHRYGNYTPLTEAGRLASICFAAVGIPICFRACAQLARAMLRRVREWVRKEGTVSQTG